MNLTLVTAPSVLPVTEAEVWSQLRAPLIANSGTEPQDKAHILALINAAVGYLDGKKGILGRCLVQQTWDWTFDRFWSSGLYVPLPPLISVDSITYVDTNGDTQTWGAPNYRVDSGSVPGRITPAYGETWPTIRDVTNAVTIRFTAGYAPSSESPTDYRENVPDALKHAIKILVTHWYENAGVVGDPTQIPMAFDALVSPYRVPVFP